MSLIDRSQVCDVASCAHVCHDASQLQLLGGRLPQIHSSAELSRGREASGYSVAAGFSATAAGADAAALSFGGCAGVAGVSTAAVAAGFGLGAGLAAG